MVASPDRRAEPARIRPAAAARHRHGQRRRRRRPRRGRDQDRRGRLRGLRHLGRRVRRSSSSSSVAGRCSATSGRCCSLTACPSSAASRSSWRGRRRQSEAAHARDLRGHRRGRVRHPGVAARAAPSPHGHAAGPSLSRTTLDRLDPGAQASGRASRTRRPSDRSRSLSTLSPSASSRADCACCSGRPSISKKSARAGGNSLSGGSVTRST
jgi:hypothetical protein